MTILDVCVRLDEISDNDVIYAERIDGEFQPKSAVTIHRPDVPCQGENLDYCLEASIAKDAVAVWSKWRNGQTPTSAERVEAVCYKANNDAWGPPNFPT